jgi:hypothetical protein
MCALARLPRFPHFAYRQDFFSNGSEFHKGPELLFLGKQAFAVFVLHLKKVWLGLTFLEQDWCGMLETNFC